MMGQRPRCVDLLDRRNRIAHVARRRVFVGRLDDVNQVMGNAAPLGERHLVGADVEAAVHGRRIAADDFAAAPQRQLDAERALARRRGTQDGEYRRRGRRCQFLKMMKPMTNPSRISRPSCCGRVGSGMALPEVVGVLVVEERHREERRVRRVFRRAAAASGSSSSARSPPRG